MVESQPHLDRDALSERRASLQRTYRWTFFLGLCLAAAVHVWILFENPSLESESATVSSAAPVDLSLLEPTEVFVDGRPLRPAGGWPVLLSNYGNAQATLNLLWPPAYRSAREGGSAALRLELRPDGTVAHAELVEGSGDMLKDKAFVQLAGHFKFTFHVGDASPAEVTLVQPIRVSPRE